MNSGDDSKESVAKQRLKPYLLRPRVLFYETTSLLAFSERDERWEMTF